MQKKSILDLLLLISFGFITTASPHALFAASRYVAPTAAECESVCSDNSVSPCNSYCFTSVQSAIDVAASGDTIVIYPGTYREGCTLNKDVSIYGIETARVLLYGTGSDPALRIDSVTSPISIKRIFFRAGTVGILVSNTNSSIEIKNNTFWLGDNGTGVKVTSSPSTRIINNTFYKNAIAVSRDEATVEILNNIFSGNTINIEQGSLISEDNISYNCFHPITAGPKGTNYIPNASQTDPDPKFVNALNGDFHLRTDSPCIDTGSPSISDPDFYPNTTSDMGAYGGIDTDTIPFAISGLSVISKTDTSITISWTPNECYLIEGYNIYYDSDKSGAPYDGTDSDDGSGTQLPSPIDVGKVNTYTIANLDPDAAKPDTPESLRSEPANYKLKLTWTAVPGASGYNIYAEPGDCSAACPEPMTETVSVVGTNYILDGLMNPDPNPHCYCITISAYAQAAYYVAVKAYYVKDDSVKESLAYSNQVSANIGPLNKSEKLSPPIRDYPEPITPYPGLPNTGCFIATAAYGYYSAPHVQALREFRDRYLMTSRPGRAFVKWYYRHSPTAAEFLNAHPALKPVARAALLPAVFVAIFFTKTSLTAKLFFLTAILTSGVGLYLIRGRASAHMR